MNEAQKARQRELRAAKKLRREAAREPQSEKKKTHPVTLAIAGVAAMFAIWLPFDTWYQTNGPGSMGAQINREMDAITAELETNLKAIEDGTYKSQSSSVVASSTGSGSNHHVADNLNAADQLWANGMDGCGSVSIAISAYNSLGATDVPRSEVKSYADRCGLRF